MKLSGQHINEAWLYIVTKMVLLTKIGENKEVNMDVQITGNSLIIKILDYREIIEPLIISKILRKNFKDSNQSMKTF